MSQTAAPAAAPAGGFRLADILGRIGFLPLLLILVIVLMSLVEPKFYGWGNVINILRQASWLAIIACGQALVIIVGGFDLSVGATVALASVVMAKTMAALAAAYPDTPAIAITVGLIAGLGSGIVVGIVNGLCVAYLRISGFIVTLGTMSAALGVALILTNGIPVYGMPDSFVKEFGRGQFLGLPLSIYVALIVIALVVFLQRRTLLGRYIFAIGGNAQAATVSGVSTRGYLIATYAISGLLAALTGVLLTAQVGSGQASFGGDRMMLQSIAAAVIGGVSLRGGIGKAEMVALSSLFLTILTNSLNLLKVNSKIQLIFLGIIMVAAVAIDEIGTRRARSAAGR